MPAFRRALFVLATASFLSLSLADLAIAKVYRCSAGDVLCLIDSVRRANERPGDDRIILEAGTYTLTVIDNTEDSSSGIVDTLGNALPSITGGITIEGTGATDTIITADGFAVLRILHIGSTGHVTLRGVTIQGGAAEQGAGIFNRGTLTVSQSQIRDNFAESLGGGIANFGNLTVLHSVIEDNVALVCCGGGIYNEGTTTIVDSRISSNHAFGLGVGVMSQGELRIVRSTIEGNSGNFCVGINTTGTATIEHSTIYRNGGDGGGGICVNGAATIVNTTIANNVGGSGAGGVDVNDASTARLINVTIADNFAGGVGGGGIFAFGTGVAQLQNTILARNRSSSSVGSGLGPDCIGSVVSLGNNVIGDTAGCAIDIQSSDHVGDAGLGQFVDNGAPGGGYIPLLAGSPAIDAGNRAACPRSDQLGHRRVDGDGDNLRLCDIGSVEFIP